MDGDGDLDVLGAATGANDITWWENTTGDGSAWTQHTIDGNYAGAHSVATADVDGDGDLDVLGAANGRTGVGHEITWWENTVGNGSAWTKHTIDDSFEQARIVASADVDGDGDLDVLGASVGNNDITWWENTTGDGSAWDKRTIDGNFSGARSVTTADVDGDGDLDVLGAALLADDIAWWENTAGDGSFWTKHTIDGNFDGAVSVATGDVDGDGDLDVLAAALAGDDITWWENRRDQFRITTTDIAPLVIGPGEIDGLLRIDLAHLGRPGDSAGELESISLLLENQAGVALSDAEVNALFERLEVYRDNGDGIFDGSDGLAGTVTSFALNNGVQRFSLVDGDPNAEIASTVTATFFVIATIAADAGTESLFRATHVTENTDDSIVTYDGSTARLLFATQPNTPSSVVSNDNVAPNVLSIALNTPTPSTLSTLTYDATFDEKIAVANTNDFSLTTTGTVTGTIQSVTGTGEIRTITIGNILGEGTLRLDVNDNNSITDVAGNQLAGTGSGNFAGEVYTLDHLPPQVLSIVRFDAEAIYGTPLRFLVNFNEAVAGVDATDFEITATGTASGMVGTVTELSTSVYLVEIDNVAGEGTLGLNLIDDDSIVDTVADPAPFPLGGVGTGNGDTIGQVYALTAGTSGDFDADGDVDGADFLAWQRGFGTTYDSSDLQDWENNYGTNPAPIGAAPIAQAIIQEPPSQAPSGAQLAGVALAWEQINAQDEEEAVAVDATVKTNAIAIDQAFGSKEIAPADSIDFNAVFSAVEIERDVTETIWLEEELLERAFREHATSDS